MKTQELFEAVNPKKAAAQQTIKKWREQLKQITATETLGILKADDDGRISSSSKTGFRIYDFMLKDGELEWPMAEALKINSYKVGLLKSMKNFPERLSIGYEIRSASGQLQDALKFGKSGAGLTSLEGCPKIIAGWADFSMNPNMSFHNIHKFIDECWGIHFGKYNGPILGIFKITGLIKVGISDNKLYQILNSYLDARYHGQKVSILDCQEELIKNGYKEYAKL